MTTTKRRRQMRYPFHFTFTKPDGERREFRMWVRARYGTHQVTIHLDKPHVLKSKRLHGTGNTQTCSVAVCGHDHRDSFRHEVDLIDFTARRAAISTRPNKKSGMPVDCVIYSHNRTDVADLNDSKGGHDKLLEMIDRDGPIPITFYPLKSRRRSAQARAKARAKAKPRPEPTERRHGNRAKRRFAVAQLGMTA